MLYSFFTFLIFSESIKLTKKNFFLIFYSQKVVNTQPTSSIIFEVLYLNTLGYLNVLEVLLKTTHIF